MTYIQKYGYILLIVFLCSAFTLIGVLKETNTDSVVEIDVEHGDTLWGLSQVFAENSNTDKWIKEVMKLNEMDSTMIKSGDTLKLPGSLPAHIKSTELAGE